MATVELSKDIHGTQLLAELRAAGVSVTSDFPRLIGDQLTVDGDLTDAQLADAVEAHTANPDFIDPGPAKDWRDRLRAEVAFIDGQLESWPTDATTTAQALQRVNFLLAATQRLARNQARILRFIDNATTDSA